MKAQVCVGGGTDFANACMVCCRSITQFAQAGNAILAGPFAAASDNSVAWWSRNWACKWRLDRRLDKAREEIIRAIAFTPDGRRLVTGSEDQTCRVWDLETGVSLLRTDSANGIIHSLAFGPDQRALFTGSCEEQVTIVEAAGE